MTMETLCKSAGREHQRVCLTESYVSPQANRAVGRLVERAGHELMWTASDCLRSYPFTDGTKWLDTYFAPCQSPHIAAEPICRTL